MISWSLNNYLGLGNHPEVRKADEQAARDWGLAYPMGARMMSGNTKYHEQLENDLILLRDDLGEPDDKEPHCQLHLIPIPNNQSAGCSF